MLSKQWTYGFSNLSITIGKGNVLSIINDKVIPHQNGSTVDYWLADIRHSQDYSPFGAATAHWRFTLHGRDLSLSTTGNKPYRYGFQNQEEDPETGLVNYKYRMHDPRLGRFFAIDPLIRKYPFYSSYSFSGNRVIDAIEIEGLEPGVMFPSTRGYKFIESEGKTSTDNWQVYDAHSWLDMTSCLKKIKAEDPDNQIKYVYIQLHGNGGGIAVGPNKDQNGFILTDTYGASVGAWDLKEYKSYKAKGADKYKRFNKGVTFTQGAGDNTFKRTYDYWADHEGAYLDQFFALLAEIPDGATVILGACNLGNAEEFLKMVYEISGKRLNFIANPLVTSPAGDVPLDNKLSYCGGTEGWVIVGVSTGGEIQNVTGTDQEGFTQCKSTGENPFIFTETACPE